jgi:hypothetical protein
MLNQEGRLGDGQMRKSEYRQRRQKVIELFDPKQFHSFEIKIDAVNTQATHLRILRDLYHLSRSTRTLKERIVDFFLGE